MTQTEVIERLEKIAVHPNAYDSLCLSREDRDSLHIAANILRRLEESRKQVVYPEKVAGTATKGSGA